jgi:hypothetical protein
MGPTAIGMSACFGAADPGYCAFARRSMARVYGRCTALAENGSQRLSVVANQPDPASIPGGLLAMAGLAARPRQPPARGGVTFDSRHPLGLLLIGCCEACARHIFHAVWEDCHEAGQEMECGQLRLLCRTCRGITAATVKIRSLPLGADETVADARSVLEAVVAGALGGAAVAWIRNLFVR